MRSSYLLLGGALVVAIAAAAWPRSGATDAAAVPSARADETPTAAPAAPAATGPVVEGTVLETIQVPSYTYLRLQTASGEQWAAVQTTTLATGATAKIVDAVPMEKFESKALKRTFDMIYFGSLDKGGAPTGALPPGHPAVGDDPVTGTAPGHPTASAASAIPAGAIEKAPGGLRISEVFEQRKSLAGKVVSVRGVVTKATAVMGAYYVHLADGTGATATANNDLTVVLGGATGPSKGDTILVSGKVELDKDIGAGYQWPVILVDATTK